MTYPNPTPAGPAPAARPLITRVQLKMGEMMFKNRPVPSADQATVFLDRYGRYHHLTEQIPVGGTAGYRVLFLVDTSVFSREFRFELPSSEQAFSFLARVAVTWRITDPVEAVETNLVDAEPVLRPYVERALRNVSGGFPIEDGAGAERAMALAFADPRRKQPFTQGVSVLACDAALSLDAATTAYITKRTENARAHAVTKEDLVRAGIEQAAQQQIDVMRTRHELEVRRLEEEHQLRLDRRRMEFYGDAIAQDPNNAIGFMLSHSPERAADVVAMLAKQHRVELDDARQLLELMLENNLVARSDITGILNRSTAVLTQRTSNAPFKLDPEVATLPPAGPPAGSLEQPLNAEVVSDSSRQVFGQSDFDDDEDDDDDV